MPDELPAKQWDGRTYYGRRQLKPAPFHKHLVGGYIFLAGLSGGAALLSALLDLTRGAAAAVEVRRGRLLSLLAPTVGSALLVADLHTPKRFYNMLRVFKRTSPMSIGTWILMTFSGSGIITAIADWVPWLRPVARVSQVPAAAAGAGLGSYTAGLLSATSTPLWAAAPNSLSVRFAASSVASAAAALSLLATGRRTRRDLDAVCIGALAVELAATLAADRTYHETGVAPAQSQRAERIGNGLGVLLPIGLLGITFSCGYRSRLISGAAACLVLAESLRMRVAMLGDGGVSASRPDISLRVAQGRPTAANEATAREQSEHRRPDYASA